MLALEKFHCFSTYKNDAFPLSTVQTRSQHQRAVCAHHILISFLSADLSTAARLLDIFFLIISS